MKLSKVGKAPYVVQVTAPHFCAGVVVKGGMITRTAPILNWAKNHSFLWFAQYCGRKGWAVHTLPYRESISIQSRQEIA